LSDTIYCIIGSLALEGIENHQWNGSMPQLRRKASKSSRTWSKSSFRRTLLLPRPRPWFLRPPWPSSLVQLPSATLAFCNRRWWPCASILYPMLLLLALEWFPSWIFTSAVRMLRATRPSSTLRAIRQTPRTSRITAIAKPDHQARPRVTLCSVSWKKWTMN